MSKILVVEDDEVLSTILVRNLVAAQYDVHASMGGFDAELEIKTWKPDLVLLDLLMPDEDGFAVLRKIREDSTTFHTRVIVLSNLSGEETVEKVRKFGVSEYFIKSHTTPGEIVAKLKTMFT